MGGIQMKVRAGETTHRLSGNPTTWRTSTIWKSTVASRTTETVQLVPIIVAITLPSGRSWFRRYGNPRMVNVIVVCTLKQQKLLLLQKDLMRAKDAPKVNTRD